MLIMIRGAGDLATGIALRLHRAGFQIVMTEIEEPLSIRRTVCFSEAVRHGETTVEGVKAVLVHNRREVGANLAAGNIPIIVDPEAYRRKGLLPDVFVDAALAKKNLGTDLSFAPIVIAVGPGFTAGEDCHAVIESMRGHTLGRVITEGSTIPDTKTPGDIGGYTTERLLRTPCAGRFKTVRSIGDIVEAGEVVAEVDGVPVKSIIKGVLRGLLADDTTVPEGLKCGDVDPRCRPENCNTASDKALAIGGGVLEAIMMLAGNPYENKIFPTKTGTNRTEAAQSDLDSRSRWEDLSDETFA